MTKTTILITILAAALGACTTADTDAYPTIAFNRTFADGRTIVVYGAYSSDVCQTIADAACESERCRLEFFARCNPLGRDGIIESPTLEGWDALWAPCLSSAADLTDYTGEKQLARCATLTPFWLEGR